MYRQTLLLRICLPLLLFAWTIPAIAQTCTINNFSISYQGANNQSVVHSLLTPQNEILSIGNISYLKNNIVMSDGWISRYTAQGSVIWSKRITAPGFDLVTFRDIVAATDSTYFITGFVQTYWGVTDPAPPNPNWGILLHIDKYGNLLWSKKIDQGLESGVESSFLENIIKTKDGDFIADAVVWKKSPFQSKRILLRINNKAVIKWATSFASDVFEFKFNLSTSIHQTASGNIVTAGIIDKRLVSKDSILKVNYYLLGVDYANGNKLWDKSYLIRAQSANVFFTESSVRHINELPNGDLSFLAFADTNSITVPPITTRSVLIHTDATGNIKNTTGYLSSQPGSYPVDGSSLGNSGNQLLLLLDANQTTLSQVANDGQVQWQKSYSSAGGTQIPASLSAGNDGYYIFLNNSSGKGAVHLLKTDANADLACRAATAQLSTFDAMSLLKPDNAEMIFKPDTKPAELFSALAVNSNPYPLQMTVDCKDACCKDVIDLNNITEVTICENETYTLPNKQVVKDSGNYFIASKTALGCDSIYFYHVTVIKHPSALTLGKDTCIEGRDSLILQATPGYANYNWMNTNSTQPFYTVKQSGTYTVSVSNKCGNKSSTIQVFAVCDPEVFIPTAFTPNGDNLNDLFRVPPSVKYKLESFKIYNRWGEIIFSTTDITKGWDGTYKRIQQQPGAYTYVIVIESISTGRKTTRSGNVQLIR
jgi:gliding motility-associated-like protein